MMPAVVGGCAGRSGFMPSSRSARAGFGPRVILRTRPRDSRKPACSRGSCRSMQPRIRRRPSPVVRIRSSQAPPAKARANARTGAGSGASRIATSGQRTTLAPRRSSMAANTSSSRVSGTAMVRPASGFGSIPRHLSRAAPAAPACRAAVLPRRGVLPRRLGCRTRGVLPRPSLSRSPRPLRRHGRGARTLARVMLAIMVKTLAVLVVLIAALAGYTWITLHWSYSDGERAGYVQKLSRKGWLCKTWEGEMAMVTMPGTVAEKFAFTVREPAVVAKLNANVGKRVALHYEQHKWIPSSCFGDSEYFVTGVRVTE